MVNFRHQGDFSKVTRYLAKVQKPIPDSILNKYGERGVAALASTTPVDTGRTAGSWSYKVERGNGTLSLSFHNSNIQNGVPIAIILYYGHGTRTGGWVQGRDYINPALQPIFDALANEAWREVTKT